MNDEMINQTLNQLRDGEMKEYMIKKEDFLPFRKVLVQRKDFKQYRGVAQRGGDIIYRYVEEARS